MRAPGEHAERPGSREILAVVVDHRHRKIQLQVDSDHRGGRYPAGKCRRRQPSVFAIVALEPSIEVAQERKQEDEPDQPPAGRGFQILGVAGQDGGGQPAGLVGAGIDLS
ncbi:MAG: hypothetical protein R2849_08890 [Thermomicrobiales bacterium]